MGVKKLIIHFFLLVIFGVFLTVPENSRSRKKSFSAKFCVNGAEFLS